MDIAIWGTGNVGKYVQQQLKGNRNYNVKYFVDSNSMLQGSRVNGVEVISPEKLQNIFNDELAFLLVAFTNGISIYEELLEMKIGKFGIVRNKVFELQLDLERDLFQDKKIFWSDASYCNMPILKKLETNIVDDCNLNCRGCSHFSNLYEHGEKVPFEVFCKDLQQIARNVHIYQFCMLGGEALLDNKISEYIRFTRKTLPDSEIQLITNGLLIPKQTEEFFQCCRENDIIIGITGYKPTVLLKDKIIDVLEKNNIIYFFRINKEEFGKNIDLTGTADKDEAVRKCREHTCHFLRYGKVYKCPFEALGNKFFAHYHLDIRFNGGTDIYDENMDWNAWLYNLEHNPVDACRYCGEEEKMKWSVTNSPVLEDWVVRKK